MLYTVVPLERIYTNQRNSDKNIQKSEENKPEFKELQLPNGRIVARREGENYLVEQVSSTDMSDYLKEEYTPGNNISF